MRTIKLPLNAVAVLHERRPKLLEMRASVNGTPRYDCLASGTARRGRQIRRRDAGKMPLSAGIFHA